MLWWGRKSPWFRGFRRRVVWALANQFVLFRPYSFLLVTLNLNNGILEKIATHKLGICFPHVLHARKCFNYFENLLRAANNVTWSLKKSSCTPCMYFGNSKTLSTFSSSAGLYVQVSRSMSSRLFKNGRRLTYLWSTQKEKTSKYHSCSENKAEWAYKSKFRETITWYFHDSVYNLNYVVFFIQFVIHSNVRYATCTADLRRADYSIQAAIDRLVVSSNSYLMLPWLTITD